MTYTPHVRVTRQAYKCTRELKTHAQRAFGRPCLCVYACVCVSAPCERASVVVMMGLHLSVGEADQALTSTVRVRATWYLRDDEVLAWCIGYLGTCVCGCVCGE